MCVWEGEAAVPFRGDVSRVDTHRGAGPVFHAVATCSQDPSGDQGPDSPRDRHRLCAQDRNVPSPKGCDTDTGWVWGSYAQPAAPSFSSWACPLPAAASTSLILAQSRYPQGRKRPQLDCCYPLPVSPSGLLGTSASTWDRAFGELSTATGPAWRRPRGQFSKPLSLPPFFTLALSPPTRSPLSPLSPPLTSPILPLSLFPCLLFLFPVSLPSFHSPPVTTAHPTHRTASHLPRRFAEYLLCSITLVSRCLCGPFHRCMQTAGARAGTGHSVRQPNPQCPGGRPGSPVPGTGSAGLTCPSLTHPARVTAQVRVTHTCDVGSTYAVPP